MTRLLPIDARVADEARVADIVAPQYDSLALDSRFQYAVDHPDCFLNIVLSRRDFPEPAPHESAIAQRAADHFEGMVARGLFPSHGRDAFFLYELATEGHSQVGIVGGVPISAIDDGSVLGHEGTINERTQDLAGFYRTARLTSSPVALAFQADDEQRELLTRLTAKTPIRDFAAWDGVQQRLWVVDDPVDIAAIEESMDRVERFYVTDGHHRLAAAQEVDAVPGWFLSVLFPAEQMRVLEYNRCVALAHEPNVGEIAGALGDEWELTVLGAAGEVEARPSASGDITMLADGVWHQLRFVGERPDDPVDGLDVSLLHQRVLAPAFGVIDDQDERLSFVVGEDAGARLEEVGAADGNTVAFALHPMSVGELFDVANAGRMMPAKSTWFTPKPRSGLLVVCW